MNKAYLFVSKILSFVKISIIGAKDATPSISNKPEITLKKNNKNKFLFILNSKTEKNFFNELNVCNFFKMFCQEVIRYTCISFKTKTIIINNPKLFIKFFFK